MKLSVLTQSKRLHITMTVNLFWNTHLVKPRVFRHVSVIICRHINLIPIFVIQLRVQPINRSYAHYSLYQICSSLSLDGQWGHIDIYRSYGPRCPPWDAVKLNYLLTYAVACKWLVNEYVTNCWQNTHVLRTKNPLPSRTHNPKKYVAWDKIYTPWACRYVNQSIIRIADFLMGFSELA